MSSSPLYVRITRPDPSKLWGFRMQGGIDQSGLPLVITHLNHNGLGERHNLQVGDHILMIGGDNTRNMSHQQAQQAVHRCCNELDLVVVRGQVPDAMLNRPKPHIVSSPTPIVAPTNLQSFNFNAPFVNDDAPTKHSSTSWIAPQVAQFRPLGGNRDLSGTRSPIVSHSGSRFESDMPIAHPYGQVGMSQSHANPSNRAVVNINQSINSLRSPTTSISYESKPSDQFVQTMPYNSPMPQATPQPFQQTSNIVKPTIPKASNTTTSNMGSNATPYNEGQSHRKGTQVSYLDSASYDRTPICHVCGIVIRGPFINALDFTFCPDCFCCNRCNKDMRNTGFVEQHETFYCENCFAQHLAAKCHKCNQPIVGLEVTAMKQKWHAECFVCTQCGIQLSQKTFRIGDDNLPYCEPHWAALYAFVCAKCNQIIDPLDRFLEAFDKTYHASCFTCAACNMCLDGKGFVKREGKAFCKAHARAVAIY